MPTMQRRLLMHASAAALTVALFGRANAAEDKTKHPRHSAPKPHPAKPAARPEAATPDIPAGPGPGLTTEAELPGVYPAAIAPFYGTGEAGDFTSTRGSNIRIRFMRFIRPGADTAIVISSGRTECMIKYKELIYDLQRNGHSVFIHDHRGQGFSSRLLADPMIGHVEEFDDYVADLKTFFDDQVKPTGHRRHVLLSHSMGGCIAAMYLEKHQRDFDRAILSSPMFEPRLPVQEASVFAVSAADTVGLGDLYIPGGHRYDHLRTFDIATNEFTHSQTRWQIAWDEYNAEPSTRLGSPSLHWVRVAYAAGRTAQDRASRIVVPVLLLQAGADSIVVPEAQNRFNTRLNYAHPDTCTLVQIPRARHEMFIEADEYRSPALDRILAFIPPAA
jgi:lysophospholipase